MLKTVERVAKQILAQVAALLLWRPGRGGRARAALGQARRVLLLRIDARVGEALLTTPLVGALAKVATAPPSPPPSERLSAASSGPFQIDVCVHRKCAPLLQGAPGVHRLLTLDRRWLAFGAWAPGIRALRAERYDVVVDCANWTAPSVTSALVARLAAGKSPVVGPAGGGLGRLRDVAVKPRPDTPSEVAQRLHLLSPLVGPVPDTPMAFRTLSDADAPHRMPTNAGATNAPARSWSKGSFAVINPGGRLGWRRVPPELFAAAARAALARGLSALVTWGPGEESLAEGVLLASPGATLAPPTRLNELAWLFARAKLAVCNNTGPMHLAVALGTPTVGLFYRMEMARWGHLQAPHRMLELTPLLASGAVGDAERMVAEAVTAIGDARAA